MPLALMAPTAWRIGGVARGRAVFPPRCDRVHPPQTPGQPSLCWVPCHAAWLGCAAVGYGAVGVILRARARAERSPPPWPYHAAGAPALLVVAVSFRRGGLSGAWSNHRKPDSERPDNALVGGTYAARGCYSGDIRSHSPAGRALAREYKGYHPGGPRLESRSYGQHITFRTVATHEPRNFALTVCVNQRLVFP
jgi:hypothetical protein